MGCRARGDVLSRGRGGSRGDRGRGAHHGDVEGESREVHVAEILLGGLHVAEGGVAAHAAVQEFLASLEADVVHAERLLKRLVSLHALARGVQRLALREERVGVGRRAEKRERRAATRRGDTRRAAGAPAREEDASANLTPETSRARELSRGGRHDARRGDGRPRARGRRDITRDRARDGDARDGEHPSTNAARRSARCGVTLTIVSRYLHRRSRADDELGLAAPPFPVSSRSDRSSMRVDRILFTPTPSMVSTRANTSPFYVASPSSPPLPPTRTPIPPRRSAQLCVAVEIIRIPDSDRVCPAPR